MIYELGATTIKHHFPRAVLMTWQERHFITAAACRTDTDSETLPPKLLIASGLSCSMAAILATAFTSETNLNSCST